MGSKVVKLCVRHMTMLLVVLVAVASLVMSVSVASASSVTEKNLPNDLSRGGVVPVVSPEGTCTAANGTWSGTGADQIVWDFSQDCTFTVQSARLSHSLDDYKQLPWYVYRTQIVALRIQSWEFSGSDLNMNGLFEDLATMISVIGLEHLDVSHVSNLMNLFCDDYALQRVSGLSGWDTSNVTVVQGAFARNFVLNTLNISGWDLSKVTNWAGMFDVWGTGRIPGLHLLRLKQGQTIPADAFSHYQANWNGISWVSDDSTWHGQPAVDGVGVAAHSGPAWYGLAGIPVSVTFDANGGAGTAPGKITGTFPGPAVTIPSISAITRHGSGYRTDGWSSDNTATHNEYVPDQQVFLPLDDVDTTLYAVWKALPVPTVSDVVPVAGGNGLTRTLKVTGTVPVGSDWAATESADKVEVAPERASGSSAYPVSAVQGTIDAANCTLSACPWTATFPATSFFDDDETGQGVSYAFKAKLTTTSDGDSTESTTYPTKTVDVVRPSIETSPSTLVFDKRNRTVSGKVWSADGDYHQPSRLGESDFSVRIEWPAGSSPASTTLKCASGVASVDGVPSSAAACSSFASGPNAGMFKLPIPSGVRFFGTAELIAYDAPAAGTITQTGVGVDHPNASVSVPLDLTVPRVTSMPLTGADWRSLLRRYLPLALALAIAALISVRAAKWRRRADASLRI
ncbi:BspA family leucine-rich repeat surface protein [Bifidobacterium sp. ESL0763]|uniref:BspA family leucine-rich repeat surface protein n=1 Tax=Bifidobacterium sp. ESL0763 TaxID=2983227 RepID=UPI0023F79CFF|nr:BspA family leucine-rich repeat surface protein [Bifidobacterium sp. ESL0763]MDF7664296.1 BspA family leucine-rich repeat surface protein [Bifidobacterium sp. ESL0763]